MDQFLLKSILEVALQIEVIMKENKYINKIKTCSVG